MYYTEPDNCKLENYTLGLAYNGIVENVGNVPVLQIAPLLEYALFRFPGTELNNTFAGL